MPCCHSAQPAGFLLTLCRRRLGCLTCLDHSAPLPAGMGLLDGYTNSGPTTIRESLV